MHGAEVIVHGAEVIIMVTWLKSWEEGLLTHIDSSDGSHEDRRGPVKERRGP